MDERKKRDLDESLHIVCLMSSILILSKVGTPDGDKGGFIMSSRSSYVLLLSIKVSNLFSIFSVVLQFGRSSLSLYTKNKNKKFQEPR